MKLCTQGVNEEAQLKGQLISFFQSCQSHNKVLIGVITSGYTCGGRPSPPSLTKVGLFLLDVNVDLSQQML